MGVCFDILYPRQQKVLGLVTVGIGVSLGQMFCKSMYVSGV